MATEIERKFLVHQDLLPDLPAGTHMLQGYVSSDGGNTVRIRVTDDTAWLTLKGPAMGISRSEFEYPVPLPEAHQMLTALCGDRLVEKTRYRLPCGGVVWELDIFAGRNTGLILAEVELASESQAVELPVWVSTEVSLDPRYRNSALAVTPYLP